MIYRLFLKRLFDFIIAFICLVFMLPLFLMLVLILAYYNRGKILFLQARPGKNGQIFMLIKFKTMTDCRDDNGNLLIDNERITKLGKILRKLSIDELPQLINVLKGDMSLIGPRPLLVEYLPLYSARHAKRHNVRPGITGWAQVNGRNSILWREKFDLDIWYIENLTFWLDFKIFLLTIKKVLKRDGVNATESVTMKKFDGYN